MRTKDAVREVCLCLERAAEALKEGNFARLASLCAALETQVAGLSDEKVSANDLLLLRGSAARQLALLEVAREGIRAATSRVREIHRLSLELSTYDRDGRGTTFHFTAGSLEHRA